ncbi:MAG: signal peptide peptidase SppA [Flavobacteriaceae bacterium]|jgi:protease-4|nr:signal peptide peptidase SppA [Flavobacteriaceae bacterium]
MKSFFKNVLANIVAFIIVNVAFFMLLFFIIAISFPSGKPDVKVTNNSVLVLDLNANIIDSPTEDDDSPFSSSSKIKNLMVYDVVQAINKAKNDDNIKGISIESDYISAGITQLDDVRNALEDFKKSGKFVYAYGNVVSQGSYYLGSIADQYYLNPVGGIDLKGMSVEITFLKNFMEKYGIGVDVIRHGKFKSAVEPYLNNEISPENKEQLSVLLNDIWGGTSKKISASRKMDSLEFKTVVDSLYGIIPELSLQYKLADKLIQKTEYEDLIKLKLNIDKTKKLNKISFSKYIDSFKKDNLFAKDQIAVLYASGEIMNGENYRGIFSETFVKQIKKLADDKNVKAVVFRINSPGGSANASDEIMFELAQLKSKKPLVVSFGDYAASGGYYIAMAADKIYSEPNTLTGSIGVFGAIPNFKELANRNGIRSDVVQTNANSVMFSALQGLSDGSRTMLTKSVEQTYKRFVHHVTQNRKKTFEQIDEIGGGRVWSGTRAKELGLVDEIGTLQDAIDYAAKLAKMPSYKVSSYPEKKTWIELLFKDFDEDEATAKILKEKLGEENYRTFEMLSNTKLQNQTIAELPYRLGF